MEQNETLMKVETFKEIITTAPDALQLNEVSVTKALDYGKTLMDTIEAEGMNDELDQQCNNYLVKLKKTHIALDERRKPITQIFDQVKKLFTDLENKISQKSEIYLKIQKFRDDYAAKKLREQQEREREAQRKQAVEQEKINIKAAIETGLATYVYAYIDEKQKELLNIFESATLENYDETVKKLTAFSVDYPAEHYTAYKPNVVSIYLTKEDVAFIVNEYSAEKYGHFAGEFKQSIEGLKNTYLDKLPSKKTELEEIHQAEIARQKAIEEAKKKSQEIKEAALKQIPELKNELESWEKKFAAATNTDDKAAIGETINILTVKLRKAELESQGLPVDMDMINAELEKKKQQAEQRRKEEEERLSREAKEKEEKARQQAEVNKNVATANTLFNQESDISTGGTAPSVRKDFEIVLSNQLGYLALIQFYFERDGKYAKMEDLDKMKLSQIKAFCEKWYKNKEEKIENQYVSYREKVKTIAKA